MPGQGKLGLNLSRPAAVKELSHEDLIAGKEFLSSLSHSQLRFTFALTDK